MTKPQAPSRATELSPGTLVAGRYEVIRRLRQNRLGVVYRAHQRDIGRDVALKALHRGLLSDERAVSRFLREARTLSQLKHPNIVTLLDFGRDEDILFLVLELQEGRTLEALLKTEGPLPPDRVVHIGAQVLAALEAAHHAGVVHRDLRPGNISVTHPAGTEDFVQVLDFAVAHMEDDGFVTLAGEVFGTPTYVSPEQAQGEPCTAQSDLYSLGIILFELLMGHPPFTAPTNMGLLTLHVAEPVPSVADAPRPVPQGLETVIRRALAKRPDERFTTAAEMRLALTRSLAGDEASPEPVPPPVSPPPAPPARHRHSGLVVIGTAGLLGAAAFSLWHLNQASVEAPAAKPDASVVIELGRERVDEYVTVFESDPPGASVRVRHQIKGSPAVKRFISQTPGHIVLPAGSEVEATFSVKDRAPTTVEFKVDSDSTVRAVLGLEKDLKTSSVVAYPPPAGAPPQARRKVVSPRPRFTSEAVAQAEMDYLRGIDAQKRGAPRSARHFLLRAISNGLPEPRATEARQRLTWIQATPVDNREF